LNRLEMLDYRRLLVPVVSLLLLVLSGFDTFGQEQRAASGDRQRLSLEHDWPWWRGPSRDGIAAPGQKPPLTWSSKENVIWSALIPGRGHGSPTVVGNQVFIATADAAKQVQSVLCLDRNTGKQQWRTDVHEGGWETKGNAKSSLASSTVACDGERVFINFLHAGGVYVTALDRQGRKLWQTKVTDFVIHQGFGASPAIFESLVIVSADHKGSGLIAGLDRYSGKIVWKRERPAKPNYTSPILLNFAGREQLVLSGCDLVTSLEPSTGKQLWESEGSTTECVTSVVTDGERLFVSGGYPRNHLAAMRADGSGKIEWENNSRVYVPSMVVHDGHLYAVLDAGIAACWNSATGQEMWKARLDGIFSSSLVLVGDNLMATNEQSQTFIFKAKPTGFEQVALNQLDDECMSTPAVCDSRIYLRVARTTGDHRQEVVYCLGK
jgi:outer membrane protein assembly factor BamB